MRIPKAKYITAVLLAFAGFAFQQAKADFMSKLNVPNDAISPFTGPYGFVDIKLVDSTTATVMFTSNVVGGNIYLFGGAQGTDLNINGTATASGFTFSQAGQTGGFLAPSEVNQGSGQVDGHGNFNLTIDYFDGFAHAFNNVTFTLTATGGTTWASASNVLAPNGDGFDAAAHIFVTSFPAVKGHGAKATGFAGENGAGVPDGGRTAMLLGMALTALGAVRRFLIS